MAKDITLIGIAFGGNKKQVEAYKTNCNIPFPIFPDEQGAIFEAVGKPNTPTMVLTTNAGKVLMSHGGVIDDFDGLVKQLREIHKKQ